MDVCGILQIKETFFYTYTEIFIVMLYILIGHKCLLFQYPEDEKSKNISLHITYYEIGACLYLEKKG